MPWLETFCTENNKQVDKGKTSLSLDGGGVHILISLVDPKLEGETKLGKILVINCVPSTLYLLPLTEGIVRVSGSALKTGFRSGVP